jgi:hypothetical protein
MATAISASVTVSIGLEMNGLFKVIFFVSALSLQNVASLAGSDNFRFYLVMFTSLGVKSMYPGRMMKSLYVKPWPSDISWAP